jgi:glucose-1-phosphatase
MVHDGHAATTESTPTSLVVFDVGGVFIDLDPQARHRALAAGGRLHAGAENPSIAEANRAFRLGHITADAYVEQVSVLYGLTHHAIFRAETSLLAGLFQDMVDYVARLKATNRVVCLSNTQAIHWRHILDHMLGADIFDACYLSHEMGLEKPDIAIYRELEDREGVTGDDIIFIDDTAANIKAARAAGWVNSIHHETIEKTIAIIESMLGRSASRAYP